LAPEKVTVPAVTITSPVPDAGVGAVSDLIERDVEVVGDGALQARRCAQQGAGRHCRAAAVGVGAAQDQCAGAGLGETGAAVDRAVQPQRVGLAVDRGAAVQGDGIAQGHRAGGLQGGVGGHGEAAGAERIVVADP
jgi:hypothetical protein